MNEKIDEMLSAFIDGETNSFEARLAMKEITSKDATRLRWESYHLIGETLRRELPEAIPLDFSQQVMSKLDEKVVKPDETEASRHSVIKPAMGLALAVSVAVVTVLGVRSLTTSSGGALSPAPQAIAEQANRPALAIVGEPVSSQGVLSNNEIDKARMNSYLANHAEFASNRGMMPHVRIVGYGLSKD